MSPKTRAKKCPVCDTESKMVAEENVVGRADHKVIVVARNFLCPKCDKIFQLRGNHSTLSVKALKKKFPKGKLLGLKTALSPTSPSPSARSPPRSAHFPPTSQRRSTDARSLIHCLTNNVRESAPEDRLTPKCEPQ